MIKKSKKRIMISLEQADIEELNKLRGENTISEWIENQIRNKAIHERYKNVK